VEALSRLFDVYYLPEKDLLSGDFWLLEELSPNYMFQGHSKIVQR
jgi:hypothetical protein